MPAKRSGPERCRRKFLRFFPKGFRDETYFDWERDYKWAAHERWDNELGKAEFRSLIQIHLFGFIAQPDTHIFLKPMVTKRAADEYDFHFVYSSRPSWETCNSMLQFGARVNEDMADLGPRDLMDAQGFIWVQGSDEYD